MSLGWHKIPNLEHSERIKLATVIMLWKLSQTVVCISPLDLSVHFQILGTNSKITMINSNIKNEMPQNHLRHLLCRPHHKFHSMRHQQKTSSLEDLIAIIKRRKLKCYGDVNEANNLSATIEQPTILGNKRQGTSWQNTTDWTGRSFTETQILACNRDIWWELVRHWILQQSYNHIQSWEWWCSYGNYYQWLRSLVEEFSRQKCNRKSDSCCKINLNIYLILYFKGIKVIK